MRTDSNSIIPYPVWILFMLTFTALVIALLWSYFGTIPVQIEGRGILVPRNGLTSVQSRLSGTVSQIIAVPESIVKKGDLLVEIRNSQLELKYEEAKLRTAALKEQLQHLKEEIARESKAEELALEIKMKAAKYSITQLNDEIAFLNKELQKRKELAEAGLITTDVAMNASQNITLKKIELEEKISELANLYSESKKEYRSEEYRKKEQQFLSEEHERDFFQIALNLGKISSPHDGKILEILANPGDEIQEGKVLIWMENLKDLKDRDYVIYGFFPVEMGKRLQPGMNITMKASTINSKEYGFLKGKVEDVSLFAVTKETILSKIQNRALVDYLTNSTGETAAVIQVLIKPLQDPKQPDQFLWTSGKQPPVPITAGTVGSLRATVEKIRPLYYLIPIPQLKYQEG